MKDMPGAEENKDKIMHVIFTIKDTKVMCSDAGDKHNVLFGDNRARSFDFKNDADIDSTLEALCASGQVTMPLQHNFWGVKFSMCKDKFGVNWMSNFDKPEA